MDQFSGMILNRLTEKVKIELKMQSTNRYAIFKENNKVASFIKYYLSNGIIGKLAHAKIEWSALLI